MKSKLVLLPISLACLVASIAPVALAENPNEKDPTKPGYNTGDLLMGFRVSGGAGAGTCYVVNIGSAATYRDATAVITVSGLGNIGEDLKAFGGGWQSRTDLFWGIAGSPSNTAAVNGDPVATLYLSRTQSSPGTSGTAPSIPSETTRLGVSTRMTATQSGFWDPDFNSGTPGVAPHTSNSTVASLQGESDPYSWRLYMAPGGQSANTPGGTDFGSGINIEANANRTLSLFRMVDGGASNYEGYFSISPEGVLTFTPAAGLLDYTTWAAANAGGQGQAEDFDGDGLDNGVEFFMGTAGNAFTANPAPVNGTVTWPRAAGRAIASFGVEISTDLEFWAAPPSGVTINATSVSYELPSGLDKHFFRLKVTP